MIHTWNMLNTNLQRLCRPTENMTIDEELYREPTSFTQYISSNPEKYGIKLL